MVTIDITPRQAIEQLEHDLELAPDELALAMGVSTRTLVRWRAGATYPQREARQKLAEMIALNHHLRDTFRTEKGIRSWMHASSRYLGGLTPADAMRAGRIDRVEAALEALDSGIYL
ncbi:hypothetical protein BH23CHL1_BH23CHL1_05170 [soil metagenome]|jgi:uncharacterized protein (DUF2384 family)